DAVQTRVLFCYADSERVRVARLDARLRRELRGGDGEYACARANVEEASAAKIFFDGREAQTRRLVRARAEGHARLDAYDDSIFFVGDFAPRRRDDEAPDLDGAPTFLPLREPVALFDLAHTHLAHVRRREAVDAKGFGECRAHALDRGRRVEV